RATSAYLDVPYRFNVPGTQSSQFGGGGTVAITNHNHIQTMDAESFESFLKKNPNALMEGFSHGMTFGHSPPASDQGRDRTGIVTADRWRIHTRGCRSLAALRNGDLCRNHSSDWLSPAVRLS
ncbi:MAG: hypothetical protein ACXVCZ_22005, partial [Bdellovibrionota bacterium]